MLIARQQNTTNKESEEKWRDDFTFPMSFQPEAFSATSRSKDGKDRETEHKFFCSEAFKGTENDTVEKVLTDLAKKNHQQWLDVMFYSESDKVDFMREMYIAIAIFPAASYDYEEFVYTATEWGYYEY